ncbi:MAG: rhomboid family intramembrane serine protease [Prevotellaceae bacterium]|nr:rhomboid family intramembrane serine protease [Prevotellaceae bacterium]
MFRTPPVTKNLLIINILAFVATFVFETRGVYLSSLFGLHFALASQFRLHQLVTYMFIHGNLGHLFFNMFALWMFGRIVEQVLGVRRFLIFYFVCGIGAGIMQELVQFVEFYSRGLGAYPLYLIADALNTWTTVGASGAIYGILLAFGMTFPNEKMFIIPIPIPIKAKYFVAAYAVIELLSAVFSSGDGVAHVAHLGGMLFALMLLLHWRKPSNGGRPWWKKLFSRPGKPKMTARQGGRFADEMDYNARRKAEDEEIDRILDKVKRHGYGSLTEEEKRKLFNAGGRK